MQPSKYDDVDYSLLIDMGICPWRLPEGESKPQNSLYCLILFMRTLRDLEQKHRFPFSVVVGFQITFSFLLGSFLLLKNFHKQHCYFYKDNKAIL